MVSLYLALHYKGNLILQYPPPPADTYGNGNCGHPIASPTFIQSVSLDPKLYQIPDLLNLRPEVWNPKSPFWLQGYFRFDLCSG